MYDDVAQVRFVTLFDVFIMLVALEYVIDIPVHRHALSK